MRLAVHPGGGLVARFEGSVALILGGTGSDTASRLLEACRSGEGAADMIRELGNAPDRAGTPFVAIVESTGPALLFMNGALKATIEMEKSRLEFASTDREGWLDETLRSGLVSVAVTDRVIKVGSQPMSDLIQGVVPGGAFELVGRGAAAPTIKMRPVPATAATARTVPPAAAAPTPAPVAPPPTAPVSAPPEPKTDGATLMPDPKERAMSESEARSAGVKGLEQNVTMAARAMPPAPPGTEIEGRPCAAAGHLNDPLAPRCVVCGAEILDKMARGPRPPLGRLVAKDGRVTVVLDRDFMVGRRSSEAPEVAAGQFTALEVPAAEGGVSRIHAEIKIAGWAVLLTDKNSANGTFIKPTGVNEWIRLEPGHTVQIVPGTGISLGQYELVFDPSA
jgi:hypothetical protein